MLYQLSYEATHWERSQLIEFISSHHLTPHGKIWTQLIDLAHNVWLHSSLGRALHRYCGGHGFEFRWSPEFFRLLLSNCLNWKIYCDDDYSLSSTTAVDTWIISYIVHIKINVYRLPASHSLCSLCSLLLTSCYGNWNKLQPDGALGSYADLYSHLLRYWSEYRYLSIFYMYTVSF